MLKVASGLPNNLALADISSNSFPSVMANHYYDDLLSVLGPHYMPQHRYPAQMKRFPLPDTGYSLRGENTNVKARSSLTPLEHSSYCSTVWACYTDQCLSNSTRPSLRDDTVTRRHVFRHVIDETLKNRWKW